MGKAPMQAIIVEDEEPSRKRLRRLLKKWEKEIEIIGEAENGFEAVDSISSLQPDILFLDIQLPGLSGLKVLESLSYQPAVIFTTAYDKYALDAFKAIAIDYLLKPIDAEALEGAITKLKKINYRQDTMTQKLEYLLNTITDKTETRIPCKVGDKIILLNPGDIMYFQADNKYTAIRTCEQEYLIDTPLLEIEKKLNPKNFLRIHRSVNADWIAELHKWFDGRLKVRLRDQNKTELTASRSYASKLKTW